MSASSIGALAALAIGLWSVAAAAEDKPAAAKRPAAAQPSAAAQPAAAQKGKVTIVVKIVGRRQVPSASIDVARLVPRAPLPQLRKPLVDRIGAAVDKAPF